MLTPSTGYAASALGRIAAASGASVLIKHIAEDCNIPGPYLAKIIHTLGRKGLVQTQRGVGGGVTLAKAAADLTLLEIAAALDDPIVMTRCMLGTAECSDERACPAHQFWSTQRERELEFLRSTTVADIAEFETSRRWRHLVDEPEKQGD